ncbi:hypothetical protein NPIL_209911 [Nephila pilipes]|uniref:Uncharacterized protein n=1 Tax=Nephila pilipes TaxID=299642 RepID=A0A8X6PA89_NEPPI|nr:hypothetical protein NPIL_209911 [Nephila pilipes]
MAHREMFEEFTMHGEFCGDLSDCPSDIYASDSENDSFLEHSSDLDYINIRSTKILVIKIDSENEETGYDTGENSFFFSLEDCIEINILRKLENVTNVPGITIECNNPQKWRIDILMGGRGSSCLGQKACPHGVDYSRCLHDINRKKKQEDWS